MRLHPRNAKGWLNKGHVHFRLKEYAPSLQAYARCLALDPKNQVALHNRSLIYKTQGRIRESLADCKRLIALAPKYALVYHTRAQLYLKLRDRARALADAGIRVPVPVRVADGAPLLRWNDRWVSAFPWVAGEHRGVGDSAAVHAPPVRQSHRLFPDVN